MANSTAARLLAALLLLFGLVAVAPQASAIEVETFGVPTDVADDWVGGIQISWGCEPDGNGGQTCHFGVCYRFDAAGGFQAPDWGTPKPGEVWVQFPGVYPGGDSGYQDGNYHAGYPAC